MLRETAKLVLGALGFLIVISYFAVPCMTGDRAQFSNGPQSCNQHHVFKPQADLAKALIALPPQEAFRFLVVLATALLASVFGTVEINRHRIRKKCWRRVTSLPFATADPPRLPYFAALRDA